MLSTTAFWKKIRALMQVVTAINLQTSMISCQKRSALVNRRDVVQFCSMITCERMLTDWICRNSHIWDTIFYHIFGIRYFTTSSIFSRPFIYWLSLFKHLSTFLNGKTSRSIRSMREMYSCARLVLWLIVPFWMSIFPKKNVFFEKPNKWLQKNAI